MSYTQSCCQGKSELRLLCKLAEAEEDIKTGRVAPMQETFHDIRNRLFEIKNER